MPSSVTRHLLSNAFCTDAYKTNTFNKGSNSELQLSILEMFYITKHQLILCKQKVFHNLLLFNPTDYTTTKPDLVKEKVKENSTNSSR